MDIESFEEEDLGLSTAKNYYKPICTFSIAYNEIFDSEGKPLYKYSKKLLNRLSLYNEICKVKVTAKSITSNVSRRRAQFVCYARCIVTGCKMYRFSIDTIHGQDPLTVKLAETTNPIIHEAGIKQNHGCRKSAKNVNAIHEAKGRSTTKKIAKKKAKENSAQKIPEGFSSRNSVELRKAVDSIGGGEKQLNLQPIQMFQIQQEDDIELVDTMYSRVCSFSISKEQLFDEDDDLLETYVDSLVKMFDMYGSPCCPIMTTKRLNKKPLHGTPELTCYAKCAILGCKRFKFTIDKISGYEVLVCHLDETSGTVNHPPIKRHRKIPTRPTRKTPKRPVKQELEEQTVIEEGPVVTHMSELEAAEDVYRRNELKNLSDSNDTSILSEPIESIIATDIETSIVDTSLIETSIVEGDIPSMETMQIDVVPLNEPLTNIVMPGQREKYRPLCSFTIPKSCIFDEENNILDGYIETLIQMFEAYNSTCNLAVATKRYLPKRKGNRPQFVCYAKCSMADCKKFKFIIDKVEPVETLSIRLEETFTDVTHPPTKRKNRLRMRARHLSSPKPVRIQVHPDGGSDCNVEQESKIVEIYSVDNVSSEPPEPAVPYISVCSYRVPRQYLFTEDNELVDTYIDCLAKMFEAYSTKCCPAVVNKSIRHCAEKGHFFTCYLKCVVRGCSKYKFTIQKVRDEPILECILHETKSDVQHQYTAPARKPSKLSYTFHMKPIIHVPMPSQDSSDEYDESEEMLTLKETEKNPLDAIGYFTKQLQDEDSNVIIPVKKLESPVNWVSPPEPRKTPPTPFQRPAKKIKTTLATFSDLKTITMPRKSLFGTGSCLVDDYDEVLNKYFRMVNDICSLQITSKCLLNGRKGNLNFTAYGECKHMGCKKFKFSVKDSDNDDDDIMCIISQSGHKINHVEFIKPEPIEHNEPNRCLVNIHQHTQTDEDFRTDKGAPIRVMRIEKRDEIAQLHSFKGVLNSHDTTSRFIKGYIQDIGYDPFFIVLMCEEQYQVYSQLGEKSGLVLFFDGFPGVFQPISRQPKKSLVYYTAVAKGIQWSVPVASCITESRDGSDIFCFFNRLMGKTFGCEQKYYYPSIINTDASVTVLQACTSAFGCGSVISYLETLWKKFVDRVPTEVNTIVHWSSAHVMNRVSQFLNTHCNNSDSSSIISIVSVLIRSRDFSFQHKIVHLLFVLCNSQRKDADFKQFYHKYEQIIESAESAPIKPYDGCELSYIEETLQYEEYCLMSPYGKHFRDLHTTVTEKLNKRSMSKNALNPFYNPEFSTYFLRHLLPFLPLWSATGLADNPLLSEDEKLCLSNNLVQTTFSCLREEVLSPDKKHTCINVIENLYDYHQTVAKTYLAKFCQQSG